MTGRRPPLELHIADGGKLTAGVGPGVGLAFVGELFPEASHIIRIATAYFSLPGYKLAREHIGLGVQLHVLVGREDGVDLSGALIAEIEADLAKSQFDLWHSVIEVIDRIKRGLFFIKDARQIETRFHCKFYICDKTALWHGSANYTSSGLSERGNAEQASVSRNPEEISQFTRWYDEVASAATDLIPPLLARLEQWVQMARPFEVYLAALFRLYGLTTLDIGKNGHAPLYYQKAIVIRSLRQIEDYRGSLAIVATGLGKTVIGAEVAQRLKDQGSVDRAIVIAPRAVHSDWIRQLEARRLRYDVFTPETLFRGAGIARHHQCARLEENLRLADGRTLIIIDEAHFAKNQLLTQLAKNRPSLVLKRLTAPKIAGSNILLLTATPYSTSPQNIASILALLPETYPGGLGVTLPWNEGVSSLIKLPVVSVLGFAQLLDVARKRGDVDDAGRPFVRVKGERRYLPRTLHLRRISFCPILTREIEEAFDERCFAQVKPLHHVFVDEDGAVRRGVADPVTNSTLTAWLSSPAALLETLLRNLATEGQEQIELAPLRTSRDKSELQFSLPLTRVPAASDGHVGERDGNSIKPYRLPMARPAAERRRRLRPLVEALRDSSLTDPKLAQLAQVLWKHCVNQGSKAIIFVRKLSTALYLQRELRHTFPSTFRIECTVCEQRGQPRLRPLHEREKLRRTFSPLSHDEMAPKEALSVLISTDADSVGVNLQDADVVISYDLPDAGDVLFQRAGRVLRMTPNPDREIWFYSFVGTWSPKSLLGNDARRRAEGVVQRLMSRHATAANILRASVMSTKDDEKASLEVDVDAEEFLRQSDSYEHWRESPTAAAANRLALLERYGGEASLLPPAIRSAKYYAGSRRRIFVLVSVASRYKAIMYDLAWAKLEELSENDCLDLIASEPAETPAAVLPSEVEEYSNSAVRAWCTANAVSTADVQKVCSMMLIPANLTLTVADLLK